MDLLRMIKLRYSYIEDSELEILIKRAKTIAIEQLYPCDLSINYETFDWSDKRFEMWLYDCVCELIERAGISSVTSYRENGMSWNFDRAGVSQALLNRLPRNISVIR